jgi:hypothetical protein
MVAGRARWNRRTASRLRKSEEFGVRLFRGGAYAGTSLYSFQVRRAGVKDIGEGAWLTDSIITEAIDNESLTSSRNTPM